MPFCLTTNIIVNEKKMCRYVKPHLHLAFAVLSITFGSTFQNGFYMAIANPARDSLRNWLITTYREHHQQKDDDNSIYWMTMAFYPLGAFIGALFSHLLSQLMGRKWTLFSLNYLIFLATFLLGYSHYFKSWVMFLFGTLFMGFAIGVNVALCPIYLIEIAPDNLRAAIGMQIQVMFAFSVMLAMIAGSFLKLQLQEKWPILFGILALPSVVQVLMLPFCPESPRYLLIGKSQEEKAYKALMWLRNNDTAKVEKEFGDLKEEKAILNNLQPRVTLKDLIMDIRLRTPYVICLVAMVGQQFCGIHVAVTFSTTIFTSVGMGITRAFIGTLCLGVMFLVITILVVFMVECAGRRLLILVSYIGMALSTTFLSISLALSSRHQTFINYFCIILFIMYVMFFSLGAGGVTWILLPELFPYTGRTLAASVTVPFNVLAGFCVISLYRVCEPHLKAYTFVIFVLADFVFFFFFYVYLPETMNKKTKDLIYIFR